MERNKKAEWNCGAETNEHHVTVSGHVIPICFLRIDSKPFNHWQRISYMTFSFNSCTEKDLIGNQQPVEEFFISEFQSEWLRIHEEIKRWRGINARDRASGGSEESDRLGSATQAVSGLPNGPRDVTITFGPYTVDFGRNRWRHNPNNSSTDNTTDNSNDNSTNNSTSNNS